MLEQRIQQHFIDSADLKYQTAQTLARPLSDAVQALLACVTNGGKVLACGYGPSAAHAQQFAAFCVEGFERERPELAAIALTASAAMGSAASEHALARQVRALGQPGDVMLVLCINGNDAALVSAVAAAHERDIAVLLACGRDGGELASSLLETDVLLSVPHDRPARVREVHTLVLHCLCDGLDAQLFGEQESV